jgi:predicted amino acid-binding ACT domain protein
VLEALSGGGARLQCCIARRQPDKPGTGVAFITPVSGARAQDAARGAGMAPADNIATLRVEGPDSPGIGSRLTRAVASAGVNMRGLSAAVIGGTFVAYFGFDNQRDADAAAIAMRGVGAARATSKKRTTAKKGARRKAGARRR